MKNALIENLEKALDRQWADFGCAGGAARQFFSPARINLIGDHIDYCGGKVLPAAIQFGTFFQVGLNDLGKVRVYSLNQADSMEFSTDKPIERTPGNHWSNYIKGVFSEYQQSGRSLPSLDIALAGNISGGGLSSSASLEVGIAYLFEAFSGESHHDDFVRRQKISWLSQRAENDFVGMNCGVMDQASVALGKENMAMCLDCETLEVDYVPINLEGYSLLIMNSCKNRNLTESAYNQRRMETETALSQLRESLDIRSICDLRTGQLEEVLALLDDDELLKRRARHVITENDRVLRAAEALKQGDLTVFGSLLNESHHSLRYDYEVTGEELDTLVGLAQKQKGVLGARMMGGGFGGCGLALLEENCVEAFIAGVGPKYRSAIGYDAELYPVEIVDGVHEITGEVP